MIGGVQAPAHNGANNNPVVGHDARGRPVQQGPRGGLFVVTAGGTKRYVKAHEVRGYRLTIYARARVCLCVYATRPDGESICR